MLLPLCGFAGVGMEKLWSLLRRAGGAVQGWRSVMPSVASQLRRRNSYPKSPFGAAHRVYLDTPPLRGRCRALRGALERLVSNQPLAFPERSGALSIKHT